MAESIRIDGLAEVKAALLETPVHLRKKVLLSVLRKAAQPILKAARANAPVAKVATKRVIPGLIRKTLGVTKSKIKQSSRGEFGVFVTARKPGKIKSLGRKARRAGVAGPNFGDPFYHKFQEGGTKFMPAKKYLGTAAENQKSAAVAIIRADVVREATAFFQKRAKR